MTQKNMILWHLLHYGSISPETARTEYACARLSARISELRDDGFIIETVDRHIINRFGKKVKYTEKYILRNACEQCDAWKTCVYPAPYSQEKHYCKYWHKKGVQSYYGQETF